MPYNLGPITVVTSKSRRVTFLEVPNEINAMIDAAKVADLVSQNILVYFFNYFYRFFC